MEGKNREIEELKNQLEKFKLRNSFLSEKLSKYRKEDNELVVPDEETSLPIGDILSKKKVKYFQLERYLNFFSLLQKI